MAGAGGQRGAAILSLVLILSALAGAGMLRHLEWRAARDMEARAHTAGAVFAQWFRAAHHLAQSEDTHYRDLVAAHGGASIPSSALRSAGLAPAWMPDETDAGQALHLGVIDDGHGVPMAFALASPRGPLSDLYLERFVDGAAANRVGDVAGPGREAQGMRWQSAIERVVGRPLGPGELFATADAGIAHDRRVLYRREQPGRSGLSRMRTPLAFTNGAGISDVGELQARRVELSEGLSAGALRANGTLVAGSARVAGDVRAQHAEGGDLMVHNALSGSQWNAATLAAGGLGVTQELAARSATFSGEVLVANELAVYRDLGAQVVRGAGVRSERVDAWGASGRLAASSGVTAQHSAGDRATFSGRVRVTQTCAGC